MLKYDSHSKLNCQHNLKGAGEYDHLKEHENLHVDIKLDIHMSSKNYGPGKWLLWPRFGLANHLVLIACSISSEKWDIYI
jgi:hypothetical protein